MYNIKFDLLTIVWTTIGAIGTMLAAIATFFAVVIALKSNKPKVLISYMGNAVHSENGFHSSVGIIDSAFVISATNNGLIPVTIKLMGFRVGRTHFLVNPDPTLYNTLPLKLETSEDCSVWTKMSDKKLWGMKYKDIAFAMDSFGNMYYVKTNIWKRIVRRVWWKFGPSYLDKSPYEL